MVLAACQTTSNVNSVDTSLWSSASGKVVVAVIDLPETQYFKLGSQGLLDMAVNHAFGKGISKVISAQNSNEFLSIVDELADGLNEKGMDAVVYDKRVPLKLKIASNEQDKINSNEPIEYDENDKNQFDISQVITETNADHVLLMQLVAFGAARSYYSFTPLGPPKGYAQIQAFWVNKDNDVDWQLAKYSGVVIEETVIGDWNQKPDYPNLVKASKKSLQSAKQYLLNSILSPSS